MTGVFVLLEIDGDADNEESVFVSDASKWTLHEFQEDLISESIRTEILAYYPTLDIANITSDHEELLCSPWVHREY